MVIAQLRNSSEDDGKPRDDGSLVDTEKDDRVRCGSGEIDAMEEAHCVVLVLAV